MRIGLRRGATWAAAVLVLVAVASRAKVITAVDEVTAKTEARFDSLTVGQRFHILYTFTYGDSLAGGHAREVQCRHVPRDGFGVE